MKMLYLALMKIRKKLFLNIFIVIEIFITLIMFINILGTFQYYYEPISKLASIKTDNLTMFYTNHNFRGNREAYNRFMKYAKTQKAIKEIGSTYDARTDFKLSSLDCKESEKLLKQRLSNDGEEAFVRDGIKMISGYSLIYDEITARTFPLPLSEGKQLIDAKQKDNCNPVILNYKYKSIFKIGSSFTIRIRWESKVVNNDDGSKSIYQNNYKDYNVTVCGFLNSDNNFYDLRDVAENTPTVNMVRRDFYGDIILLNTENDIPLELLNSLVPTGYLFKFDPSVKGAEFKEYFSKIGSFTELDKSIENSKLDFKNRASEPIRTFTIFFIVSIIGITSLNMLMQMLQKKDFAIYYICGAKWRKCLTIDLLSSAIILLIPYTAACLISPILFKNIEHIMINPSTLIISFFIIAIIYLLTSLWFNIELLKTKPIKYVKEIE